MTLRITRRGSNWLKISTILILLSSIFGCGTAATQLGDRYNTSINRQEHHSVDIERTKIIYTPEECERDKTEIDSSKCARVPKKKDPKHEGKPDG